MANNEILLSVWMITYNHEKYIAQALNSVLMQKTNFRYEVVIGEDNSTDSTRSILELYEKKINHFKVIYHNINVGMMRNAYEFTFPACSGKYIACLEGDDYWTDPYKLQKQVDFLEANPDFSMCTTNAIVRNEKTGTESEWLGKKIDDTYTLEDLLLKGSGGATCTIVFRREVINNIPSWFFSCSGGDWPLQIVASSYGKLKYLNDLTAVYRRYDESVSGSGNTIKTIHIFEDFGIKTIGILKEVFNHKYNHLLNHQENNYWRYNLMKFHLSVGNNKEARKNAFMVLKYSPFLNKPINKALSSFKVIIKSFL